MFQVPMHFLHELPPPTMMQATDEEDAERDASFRMNNPRINENATDAAAATSGEETAGTLLPRNINKADHRHRTASTSSLPLRRQSQQVLETPQMLTLGRRFNSINDDLEQHYGNKSRRMARNSTAAAQDDDSTIYQQYADASQAVMMEDNDGGDALFRSSRVDTNRPSSSWLSRFMTRSSQREIESNGEGTAEHGDFQNIEGSNEEHNGGSEATSTMTTTQRPSSNNNVRRPSPRRRTILSSWQNGGTANDALANATSNSDYTALEVHGLEEPSTVTATAAATAAADDDDCSFFFRETDEVGETVSGALFQTSSQLARRFPNRHHHGWRQNPTSPPTMASLRRNHRHGQLYEYKDAVPVMARPALQQFRTKYAQLNQELVYPTSSRHAGRDLQQNVRVLQLSLDPDPWDDMATLQSLHLQTLNETTSSLSLFEEQSGSGSANVNAPDDSYQYYYAPDGRNSSNSSSHHSGGIGRADGVLEYSLSLSGHNDTVGLRSVQPSYYVSSDLHRLPRDQVRLLMDPDLEAGILSVEQWRVIPSTEDHINHDGANNNANDEDDDDPSRFYDTPDRTRHYHSRTLESPPPLRYVLTVSDDLYRSVVAEMSPTTTKYFCCPRACCDEEERADIRVAVYLLIVILVILFINTMAFHED